MLGLQCNPVGTIPGNPSTLEAVAPHEADTYAAPNRGGGRFRQAMETAAQAGVLLALLAAILLLLNLHPPVAAHGDAARPCRLNIEHIPIAFEGQSFDPADLPDAVDRPDQAFMRWPAGNAFAAGTACEILVKGGFRGRFDKPDDMLGPCEHLAYAFEMRASRRIERCGADGATFLVQFHELRGLKILTSVVPPPIEFAAIDDPVLADLGPLRPDEGIVVVDAARAAQAMFGPRGENIARHPFTRALAAEDSLSGRRVRVTFSAERGITAIQPLDGNLTGDDLQTILQVALPLDGALLPAAAWPSCWTADARAAVAMLGAAQWQVTGGRLDLVTQSCYASRAGDCALIACRSPEIVVESAVTPRTSGVFRPRGALRYDLTRGMIEAAWFQGPCAVPQLWNDSLLFESHYRSTPMLAVSYHCRPLGSTTAERI